MYRVLCVVVLHVLETLELGKDCDLVTAGAGRVDEAAGLDGEDVGLAVLKEKDRSVGVVATKHKLPMKKDKGLGCEGEPAYARLSRLGHGQYSNTSSDGLLFMTIANREHAHLLRILLHRLVRLEDLLSLLLTLHIEQCCSLNWCHCVRRAVEGCSC